MKVVYHPRVPNDVAQAQCYYDRISVRLGDDFWAELTTLIEKAVEHPLRFRIYSEPFRRATQALSISFSFPRCRRWNSRHGRASQ
jgi:hypothetical protein